MMGKTEGEKRRGQQRKNWLDSITDSVDMNLSKLREIVEEEPDMLPSMGSQTVGQDLKAEQQQQPQAQTKLFKNWEVSMLEFHP